jgi:uncharacterized protein (TIGR00369 family)
LDHEAVIEQVLSSLKKAELAPEKAFLFHFFNFKFSYDDENKQCMIECPVTEIMFNPLGTVHGGILTYLADTAIAHLNHRFKGELYVSLELKTSYLKAVTSGKLMAKARYTQEGNNVIFGECVIENENGELISTTSGTFYRTKKR